MCLAAIYWAHLDRLYFGATAAEAAAAGFDDEFIYRQISLPAEGRSIPAVQLLPAESLAAFEAWKDKFDKVAY